MSGTTRRLTPKALIVFAITVGVMVGAGVAFIYKMAEFAATMGDRDVAGFGAIAVSTYLLGMVPILMMTLWAVFTGRFRDVEAPKTRMLELNDLAEQNDV